MKHFILQKVIIVEFYLSYMNNEGFMRQSKIKKSWKICNICSENTHVHVRTYVGCVG